MSFEELSRAAAKNEPMPDGISQSDMVLFEGLRLLYESYRRGMIEKEEAQKERRRLYDAWRDNAANEKLYRVQAQRYTEVSKRFEHIRQNGCEECRNLVRVICGLPLDKQ